MKPEKNMMKKFIFALLLLPLSVHTAFSAEMPDMPSMPGMPNMPMMSIPFPTIPEIPVPKGMGYDNYFKQNQPVKVVFGVSDPGAQLKETLTNAAYTIKYLKPRGIKYKIQIVLYGRAVLPANSFNEEYGGYSELMESLNKQGVEFAICNNSLVALNQSRDDIYPYMKIIPAGILQIIKKQMQGYAYIHNTK
ncbi:MAG TPA: hypothetical protein ENI65_07230 [Gammaproteobacteria bacterium]|nr:hypothetical protein [Gammaproteobacteria bacterium]